MKTVYLILIIISIAFFINRMTFVNVQSQEDFESLKFYRSSYQSLEKLLSHECLGHKEEANIRDQQFVVSTQKILNKTKLDFFSQNFNGMKIPCDNFTEYGIKVRVETFGYEIKSEKDGNTKTTIQSVTNPEVWEFGLDVFSEADAFEKSITLVNPVIIFYERGKQIPGKIQIDIVSGEMEKFSGFVDASCSSFGKNQFSAYFHYPTSIESINGKNYVCMEFPSGKKCQNIVCQKEIEFDKIESKGYYFIESNSQINKLKMMR
ncbi:MAG: hypothetical protein QXF12_03390 [Candidatus Aenigmatarchaeota archaeon]